MALDERDKEEIRSLVAAEIHDVLRREMAQWWAESLLALAGYPPHPRGSGEGGGGGGAKDGQVAEGGQGQGGGDGPAGRKTVVPRKIGGQSPLRHRIPTVWAVQGQPGGGQQENGGSGGGAEAGIEYLAQMVEAMLRSQEALAQQLQESLGRVEALLEKGQG